MTMAYREVLRYVSAILILVVFDLLWLRFYMGRMYDRQVSAIQNSPMKLRIGYAIVAYCLMVAGLSLFCLPNIRKERRWFSSFVYGFIFGVIVYGIYDFTSASIFEGWWVSLAIIDVLWGGFVYFASCLISSFWML